MLTETPAHGDLCEFEFTGPFTLPGEFEGGREMEELRMMARYASHIRVALEKFVSCDASASCAPEDLAALIADLQTGEELAATSALRNVLAAYNAKRLRCSAQEISDWPRASLQRLAEVLRPSTKLLPPPTPCDVVEDGVAWSCFGQHSRQLEWLGHGYFFRQRPSDHTEPLENAAGSAMNDFDVLEDGFVRLRRARVLCADHDQLRTDFPEVLRELGNDAVESWLLKTCAHLSAGQLLRMQHGGDHHELLGLEGGLGEVLDLEGPRCAGLRLRSGGRAATFFADGRYCFRRGSLQADMLDVKGVGTHASADISNPKTTGLLNLADALRELALQRLLQRLAELDGAGWQTVRYYALLDTGLQYRGTNPATGWEGERCVLLVRQAQSRFFDDYDGFNFSGVAPSAALQSTAGRGLLRSLASHGISAEFVPMGLIGGSDACEPSDWNLQVDAPFTHLMDFSDVFVLPNSPLPVAWRMSWQAVKDAFALERARAQELLLTSSTLCLQLFGTTDRDEVRASLDARRKDLSSSNKHRDAAALVDGGLILRGKPKFCMCWFMELDDSEVATWTQSEAVRITEALEAGLPLPGDILAQISAWLPM